MAFSVEKMVCRLAYWLEEVRQDVCNVQSDVGELRLELDRLRAAVAHMEKRERERELAAQAALFREAARGEAIAPRLQAFERLAA
jgi:regulator of replication initiation timing